YRPPRRQETGEAYAGQTRASASQAKDRPGVGGADPGGPAGSDRLGLRLHGAALVSPDDPLFLRSPAQGDETDYGGPRSGKVTFEDFHSLPRSDGSTDGAVFNLTKERTGNVTTVR